MNIIKSSKINKNKKGVKPMEYKPPKIQRIESECDGGDPLPVGNLTNVINFVQPVLLCLPKDEQLRLKRDLLGHHAALLETLRKATNREIQRLDAEIAKTEKETSATEAGTGKKKKGKGSKKK